MNNIPYYKTPEDKMPQEISYAYFILSLKEREGTT